MYRPYKELKGYSKDDIAAEKSVTVKKKLPLSAFLHWSAANDRWEITDGVYEILIGASSFDVRMRQKLFVEKEKPKLLENYD